MGEKIPFASGLFGGQSGAAGGIGGAAGSSNPLGALGGLSALSGLGNSVQRIDVSLKLSVTPQINERNKIRLEIDQNIEDVTSQDQRTNSFTTAHRALKTVVVVDDQQPVVLGGLMRDRSTDTETKIPILGDIPVLGILFKQRSTDIQKVNLVLVLTPYIISSPADFQRILERKLEEHEEFQAQYYGHRKEYRAYIDYQKKTGPLSRLVTTVRRENERLENGGDGDGTESRVVPRLPATRPETPETPGVAPAPAPADAGATPGVSIGLPADTSKLPAGASPLTPTPVSDEPGSGSLGQPEQSEPPVLPPGTQPPADDLLEQTP